MRTASPLRSTNRRGMTLLEVTVVIAMLLSLTSILFIGARAWKSGADRTGCIMNIRNVQLSVRTYQNLYGYRPGGMPYAEGGTQDIAVHLHTKGYITPEQFMAVMGDAPCIGGGHYERLQPDVFPAVGRLYLSCSLAATRGHEMAPEVEW